ncbi:site-2 protease family protein [Candidatus Dojkabacteria bacterium]|nr:site-2 protease family protein [Candidatus Dojkabacteria bacterium]
MITLLIVVSYVFYAIAYLLAATVHNYFQALVANKMGDLTAKADGYLTLNPLKHVDILGLALFFVSRIGWTKHVPINEYNFKKPGRDQVIVYLSGIGANILTVIACLGLIKITNPVAPILPTNNIISIIYPLIGEFLFALTLCSFVVAITNLLPLPPLDGYYILQGILPKQIKFSFETFESYSPWVIALILSPYSPIGLQISYYIVETVYKLVAFVS